MIVDNHVVLDLNTILLEDGFNIHRYRYDHYNSLKLHQHEFIEIAYVLHGFGCHIINGERYEISQGDILLIPRGITHGIFPLSATDGSDLEVSNLLFTQEYLTSIATIPCLSNFYHLACKQYAYDNQKNSSFKINAHRFSPPEQRLIQYIIELITREYKNNEKNYKELILYSLIQLFILLDRFPNSFGLQSKCKNINREIVLNTMEYIQDHYNEKILVNDLASRVLLSKNYFSSIFKEYAGLSVIDYIQTVKLDKACYYLTHTEDSISSIIDTIGYSDYRFFNQIFKRKTGLTAIKYRKKYTQNLEPKKC